jgi:hypothetical protein
VQGCGARLPECVLGKAPRIAIDKPPAPIVEVAIDGSGSMLGLTGSPQASNAWKNILKSVSNASAQVGVPIQAVRSGGGQLQSLSNVSQAGEPCFFSGCGAYPSVTSSLDSLWKVGGSKSAVIPMKLLISDLEVNNGEISSLVASIKPFVRKGAEIGVLAIKLPFAGKVYNSQSLVIHTGSSERPIYLLATGPRTQLKSFLTEVKAAAKAEGIPEETMHLTFLEQHVNKPTLTAKAARGATNQATVDMDISANGRSYGWTVNPGYKFIRVPKQESAVLLGSSTVPASKPDELTDRVLVQLEPVNTAGVNQYDASGVSTRGIQIQGQKLLIDLALASDATAGVVRATIPRGRLPEDWWISWNRNDAAAPEAKNQTDGLLPLLTSLGTLLVEPGSSPAAAFCLAYSRITI